MAELSRLRRLPVSRPASLLAGRSFAAAALQCNYDYYYEEEEEARKDRSGVGPRADECGTTAGRGVQWVLMGNPGAQKHVYAARLSRLLQVPHISMGSLVRQELNPRSSLYKQIANAVNEGRLIPEDVIFGLLSKRLEEGYYRGEMGFILDGIPRTRIQAEILDQIADVDLVVNLRCKEECLLNSNLGAGICSHCGQSSASDRSSDFCITNHQLKSSQTNVDALREKFRVYAEESKPLEDYYRKQGKLLNFQVAGGLGETWQGLLAALHLQHMDGRSPSHKLTA